VERTCSNPFQSQTAIANVAIPNFSIGTGLFVGSGAILYVAGPAALWLGYLCMMMIVWIVMNVIAEMTTYLPLKGITLPYFTERYVDSSLAFATGWNYWYAHCSGAPFVLYMLMHPTGTRMPFSSPPKRLPVLS